MSTMARLRSGVVKPKTQTRPKQSVTRTQRQKQPPKPAVTAESADANISTHTPSNLPATELRRSKRNAGIPAETHSIPPSDSTTVPRRKPALAKNGAATQKTLPASKVTKPKLQTTTNGAVPKRPALKSPPKPVASTPMQVDTEATTPVRPAAQPNANFIMSSPKRKPTVKHARIDDHTPPASACKRRRPNLASTEDSAAETPNFHSPLPQRIRRIDMDENTSDDSTPETPVRLPSRPPVSLWAKSNAGATTARGSTIESSPSPLKSILSPVLDLFRRVSGIAHDPLGLNKLSSAADDTESADDQRSTQSTDMVDDSVDAAGAPVGSPEANSLTAPPMNPTTIGTNASSAPLYLPGSMGGSGIPLYLSDSQEIDNSCNASQVTTGYPETPSKENIPVYNTSQLQAYEFDSSSSDAAVLSGVPLAGADIQQPQFQHQEQVLQQSQLENDQQLPDISSDINISPDLDISQLSSLSESELEALYEQYEKSRQYDEDEDEFNPYLFMADLPPVPEEHTLRPFALPRKTRSSPPITLVLDLDETLVHCALNKVDNADLVFQVEYNGVNYDVYCRLRPGYREFLEKASEMFEVVVFTASQQVYADRLLNLIDPERKFIKHRLFRDSCVYVNTNYVKDLGILGRDEAKMILVDNCPQAFAYQQSNGIPIESWYEDKSDRELMRLMEFLETVVGEEDVRPKVEAQFKTKEKVLEAKRRYQSKRGMPYGTPFWARAANP
ncbi:hypothetical protein GGI15_000653 [Coemansia interrupta]|uniref:FCP1 homology domain-containing protein n=1 Tax=Coemansia interrupta TaxID=1126814 RepID=A0A9W8LPM7_9FUNG|nr:hypothetical protein GGI15_000653 [Coemansia interrupta]